MRPEARPEKGATQMQTNGWNASEVDRRKDGQTERQMYQRMGGRSDSHTDGRRMERQMKKRDDARMEGCTDVRTDGRSDERMDGWVARQTGRTDRQANGWTHGWTKR